jgi:ABC-type Fe2+-enterobactin transport system substrate-binding protein
MVGHGCTGAIQPETACQKVALSLSQLPTRFHPSNHLEKRVDTFFLRIIFEERPARSAQSVRLSASANAKSATVFHLKHVANSVQRNNVYGFAQKWGTPTNRVSFLFDTR